MSIGSAFSMKSFMKGFSMWSTYVYRILKKLIVLQGHLHTYRDSNYFGDVSSFISFFGYEKRLQ